MKISISVTSDRTKFYKVESEGLTAVNLSNGAMELYTRAGLHSLCRDVNAEEALWSFKNSGVDMIPLRASRGSFLIAPSAVTFIACALNPDTGNSRVTVGVNGYAGEPANARNPNIDPDMPAAQLRSLLTTVRKSCSNLVMLQPDEGYAGFDQPRPGTALYINPETITRINEDLFKVGVLFPGTGWLHLKTLDLPDENFVLPLFEEHPDTDPHELLHLAREKRKDAERFFRHDLADMLGRLCPSLTPVFDASASLYCRTRDIASVSAGPGSTLNLRFKPDKWDPCGLMRVLDYPGDGARDTALRAIKAACGAESQSTLRASRPQNRGPLAPKC